MRAFVETVVLGIVWFGTAWAVALLASNSPAREAYGSLSGWWATLYASHLLAVTVRRSLMIGCIVLPIAMAAQLVGLEWGHDPPEDLVSIVGFSVPLAVVFVSPILVNAAVVRVVKLVSKNSKAEARD